MKCWGKNDTYQLGTTSVTYSATALQIVFPTAYTYGDPAHKHAVTALNTGESYTYDADGNMITRVEGGVTYNQTFNAENRLVSVAVGTQTTQFVYDGDGNLIKQVNPDASKTIHIDGVYEEDRNSSGTVTGTREYYAAGGAMRVNGTLYFVMGDNLGSAVLTLDTTGNTVGQERYFPFGSTRFASGSMQTDRLYTGQRNVASLGLMDYHARFYDAYLNRFISPDSIIPSYANPQSLDRYSYVLNSPIDISDPSGMKPCWATARYSCNLSSWNRQRADAAVAQYNPSQQAAVVAFFQSQGVPVGNLKNVAAPIETPAPAAESSIGGALQTARYADTVGGSTDGGGMPSDWWIPTEFGWGAQLEGSVKLIIALSIGGNANLAYNRVSHQLTGALDVYVTGGGGLGGGGSLTTGPLVGWFASDTSNMKGLSLTAGGTLANGAAASASVSSPLTADRVYGGALPLLFYIGGGVGGFYGGAGIGGSGSFLNGTVTLP